MEETLTPKLALATPVRLLVLIGGGEFSFGETRAIDEFLISHLQRKSVAFLPTASGSAEYATHFGKYLRTIDPEIVTTNVPIYRGRDVRRQKSLDAILSAGMIYLGGGVTANLVDTLRETPAELALREAANTGAVIAAIGAAASAFGSFAGRGTAGLGWIENTVIDAGYSDEALRRLMSLPGTQMGVGIPPKTALAIKDGGNTEIVGEGQVAVFRRPTGV